MEESNKNSMELEMESKQSQGMPAMIIDGLSIPTFVIDKEHKITHWNAAAESLTGAKKEEMIGTDRQWMAFYAERRPVMADLIVDGSSEINIGSKYEFFSKSKLIDGAYEATSFFPDFGEDGSWLLFTAAPLRDTDGEVIGAIETLQDITERKKAEERIKNLMEVIPTGISVTDPEGKFTEANPSTLEMLGYESKEELLGISASECYDDPKERDRFLNLLKEGKVNGFEARLKRKDGSVLLASIDAAMIKTDSTFQIIAAFTDITERRQKAEIIERQAQEILELSTPVIRIWDGVVVAPLVGTLDSMRTQRFMEMLLESIVNTNSEVALVDITGVPFIDTQTAQHLIDTISAVKLLGAEVVLTGVRPTIAQTLVHLGIELSDITTRSSMASGLKVALESLNLKVIEIDLADKRD